MADPTSPKSAGNNGGEVPGQAGPPQLLEQELVHLYRTNADVLLRYAMLLAGNPEVAQDALQDAFLRYYATRSEGHPIDMPKAWLFRVLRNRVLDELKRSRSWREVALEQVQGLLASVEPQLDPAAELSRRLGAILAPRELECVRLRAEGLRYEEIAAALSVRCGSVGALLARARGKIRKMMEIEGAKSGKRTAASIAG